MRGIEVVTEFLGRVSYPINKTKLVEAAHNFQMSDDIVRTIESLPDQQFASLEAVIPYIDEHPGQSGVAGASGDGRTSAKEKHAYDHWELDALARNRKKPSLAEGEREPKDRRPVYHISDDEGRSQST